MIFNYANFLVKIFEYILSAASHPDRILIIFILMSGIFIPAESMPDFAKETLCLGLYTTVILSLAIRRYRKAL